MCQWAMGMPDKRNPGLPAIHIGYSDFGLPDNPSIPHFFHRSPQVSDKQEFTVYIICVSSRVHVPVHIPVISPPASVCARVLGDKKLFVLMFRTYINYLIQLTPDLTNTGFNEQNLNSLGFGCYI